MKGTDLNVIHDNLKVKKNLSPFTKGLELKALASKQFDHQFVQVDRLVKTFHT